MAETTSDDDDLREPGAEAAVPVTAHAEEVELLVQRLGAILRTPVAYDAAGRASDFAAFLRTIERKCLAEKNAGVVSSAVGELYDDIIDNVLKKVLLSSSVRTSDSSDVGLDTARVFVDYLRPPKTTFYRSWSRSWQIYS